MARNLVVHYYVTNKGGVETQGEETVSLGADQ